MSGHSKWSTIKHKKASADAKRGEVFTKMAKAITVAVKQGGGGDPEFNFSLRLAIERAKAVNMPKNNIARAIARGEGKGEEGELEELMLEGYGPGGVAILVRVITDNHNRTIAEIKNVFEKREGRLGEPGSVEYQFERLGRIEYRGQLGEEESLELIDLGVREFSPGEGGGVVWCEYGRLAEVAERMRQIRKLELIRQEVFFRAKTAIKTENETVKALLESLRQHEDVQGVYANI